MAHSRSIDDIVADICFLVPKYLYLENAICVITIEHNDLVLNFKTLIKGMNLRLAHPRFYLMGELELNKMGVPASCGENLGIMDSDQSVYFISISASPEIVLEKLLRRATPDMLDALVENKKNRSFVPVIIKSSPLVKLNMNQEANRRAAEKESIKPIISTTVSAPAKNQRSINKCAIQ